MSKKRPAYLDKFTDENVQAIRVFLLDRLDECGNAAAKIEAYRGNDADWWVNSNIHYYRHARAFLKKSLTMVTSARGRRRVKSLRKLQDAG